MDRPGPLKELPLKLYLPGNPNLGEFDTNTNNKRPLSPSSRTSQSAKRRILDITAGASRPQSVVKTSRFAEPVNYAGVLNGPDSPARVLDFGGSKKIVNFSEDDDTDRTPRSKQPQGAQLTPSPKLKGRSTPRASTSSVPDSGPSSPPRRPERTMLIHTLVFDVVPRELPPLTDPESTHYPGFDVYRDPYTVIARRDNTRTIELLANSEEEPEKENTIPPREVRKLTSMFADVHTKSVSPGKEKQRLMADVPQFPPSHKRIFGNGFEDPVIDWSAPYGVPRRSRLASEMLDDSDPIPGSPLWQAHGGGDDGDGLVG